MTATDDSSRRHRQPHRAGARLTHCRHASTQGVAFEASHRDEARHVLGLRWV